MLLFAALALAGLAAPVAQALTGGASSVTAYGGSSPTGQGIAFSSPMKSAGATWYGPGLYGNGTACGQVLRPTTIGVAHRSLPCGTTVKFVYNGRHLITKVIDRGPYSKGNAWDLTNGAREALGFEGVGIVRYAIATSYARPAG
ncbi:MAG TPA: septal ring lytic transglycosylase RlpA family protein [Solirubrobacterales bacterium]|jgi:rare lipoprotein A (peptidoglycan hydrolase)|nr:septal ring lytic transglycosylase RlpA family protein [Solirubrobacterales bacterium]